MTPQRRFRVVSQQQEPQPAARDGGPKPVLRGLGEPGPFLEQLSDALYFVDDDWRLTYINRTAAQYWKRDRAGLLGKRLWEAFPQTIGSEARRMHEIVAAERRNASFETMSPVLHSWVHVSMRPLDGGVGVCFRKIAAPGKRGRVLIVEDQPQIRELLQLSLEQEGYLVILADDFEAARMAVRFLPLDAILLDDRLPDGLGSSLNDEAARLGLPLIVMSGHPTTIARFDGAANFLAKPFGLGKLLASLGRLVTRAQ